MLKPGAIRPLKAVIQVCLLPCRMDLNESLSSDRFYHACTVSCYFCQEHCRDEDKTRTEPHVTYDITQISVKKAQTWIHSGFVGLIMT